MIHALLLPIAFKIAPNFFGTAVLNTWVNKQGPRRMGVPIPVLQKVARYAHNVVIKAARFASEVGRRRMPGVIQLGHDYALHLEYCANAIREIITGAVDEPTARVMHPELVRIVLDSPYIPGQS